jgi:hypothetical protein
MFLPVRSQSNDTQLSLLPPLPEPPRSAPVRNLPCRYSLDKHDVLILSASLEVSGAISSRRPCDILLPCAAAAAGVLSRHDGCRRRWHHPTPSKPERREPLSMERTGEIPPPPTCFLPSSPSLCLVARSLRPTLVLDALLMKEKEKFLATFTSLDSLVTPRWSCPRLALRRWCPSEVSTVTPPSVRSPDLGC